MALSILFIHTGAPLYLKNALHHAKYFNPDSNIYLLGDKKNSNLGIDGVEHYFIDDYMNSANQFKDIYDHMSSNMYEYERFCFFRWYIIKDFMQSKCLPSVLVLDSDVLLYSNVTQELDDVQKYDFTVCNRTGPITTFMTEVAINKLTEYITRLYTVEAEKSKLKKLYSNFFDKNGNRIKMGGVCDMTVFDFYQSYISENVLDLAKPINGRCFDARLSSSDNFEMEKGLKKIEWHDNLPYGLYGEKKERIRFCSFHFQGNTKFKQSSYLIDAEGIHFEKAGLNRKIDLYKELLRRALHGFKKPGWIKNAYCKYMRK